MASIFGLAIIVRIKVNVVNDDDIGARQVDAKAAGARREQEGADGRRAIELVDDGEAFLDRRLAVDSAALDTGNPKGALDDIEHHCELGKDKDAVPVGLGLAREAKDDSELAGVHDGRLVESQYTTVQRSLLWTGADSLKTERTSMNCRKLIASVMPGSMTAISRSPNGFIENSGMAKKSSGLMKPRSSLSNRLNRLYSRAICDAETDEKVGKNQ